uniref:Acireductone dioxygenase n=1 Tax=Corethron hystrix TaxID=216773 RepID=A0A7S1BRE7_9STRA|mmetsp:Transcript_35884/g.83683  ORF Transcript_35884/g.83683 Transcript_35884/m.83683 type:complete len:246 (+) Transcript_35884:72-809(+)|eukprot:CAMPEP_0113305134 /NCGR_PEP_ID=MMETSP0010_2-20120614/4868_1 /TAXON_ID=216773 ORGANISM="Corethron hystrix, Strain 308" /NCGR_SAMPLE_ID=MMETSP0010_2 /ASSEMBLY_ACC=CAM_ASM_000155 /LENGTH=245 /DNA_ID=CAMNT_0000159463 /DNA_START=15 /DNA_END=752 /DNA_ORIENTATION=+ /assembly_acc=CAM_ASM_000155
MATKSVPPPNEAIDSDWPEAWYMNESEDTDQKALNRKEPNEAVSVSVLRALGISYWKLNADKYMDSYPLKAVPWDPSDAADPELAALRDDRGYSYADVITIHRDHLPNYDKMIKCFFEEHIHDAEEIRFIINGSGFFDLRDLNDKWIRIHVKKGDLMTLPEGIYHRFTCDEKDYIHAMRLFIGQPVWTPFNRPQEDHESRLKYIKAFLSKNESMKQNMTGEEPAVKKSKKEDTATEDPTLSPAAE